MRHREDGDCLPYLNSIMDYFEVQGAVKICWRGATLCCLHEKTEGRDGLKLIVLGIRIHLRKVDRSL